MIPAFDLPTESQIPVPVRVEPLYIPTWAGFLLPGPMMLVSWEVRLSPVTTMSWILAMGTN